MENISYPYGFDLVVFNAVVAWAIQKMKDSQWPIFDWISSQTPTTTRILSIVAASSSAAGMTVTWQYLESGYAFGIEGVTVLSLLDFSWRCISNFVLQYCAYKVMFKSPVSG